MNDQTSISTLSVTPPDDGNLDPNIQVNYPAADGPEHITNQAVGIATNFIPILDRPVPSYGIFVGASLANIGLSIRDLAEADYGALTDDGKAVFISDHSASIGLSSAFGTRAASNLYLAKAEGARWITSSAEMAKLGVFNKSAMHYVPKGVTAATKAAKAAKFLAAAAYTAQVGISIAKLFMNKDNMTQKDIDISVTQIALDTTAATLSIAALFVTGSIAGAPVGAVLFLAAGVVGAVSALLDLFKDGPKKQFHGSVGDDDLDGNEADNEMWGYEGDDTIKGGDGADTIWGGAGNDKLYGGNSNDNLWGGQGDNLLSGGAGNDNFDGGSGNDRAYGGDGEDILHGAAGDDYLNGGAGADTLYGGRGNDVFVLKGIASSVAEADSIADFTNYDSNGQIEDMLRIDDGITTIWARQQDIDGDGRLGTILYNNADGRADGEGGGIYAVLNGFTGHLFDNFENDTDYVDVVMIDVQ